MADTTELGSPAGRTERQRADIASGFTDFATQIGSELLAAACEGIAALADEQRHRAADQIAAIGDALHRSAESLAGNSELPLDRYADDAARHLCDFAQTVRARPWSQLANDVEGLARAEPIAFVAATVGIGVLAGRFLLSATPRLPDTGTAEAEIETGRLGDEPKDDLRANNNSTVSRAGSGDALAENSATAENA